MGTNTYEVNIDGTKYDVDAPDEATAWKWAKAEHSKPYDVDAGVASAMNVGQALTFGFGDEIAGLFGANKEKYRSTIDQFRKDYPKSAMLGTVSGSLLLPGASGKLFANAPYAAAATTGLAAGALQGAGDAPNAQSMPFEAGRSGAIGMAAAPFLLGGMKNVGGPLIEGLVARFPKVGKSWAEDVARRRVANAFEQDSVNAEQVGRTQAQLGTEARIGDSAGQNTRDLLDIYATLPGKTKNDLESVIRNRIATRPERLDDVVYSVNDGMGRARSLSDALTAQQRGVAGPLYQRVHSMNVSPSTQLVNDLEAARKLGAFGEAEKIALAEGAPFTLSGSQQQLGGGQIGMRDLDRIKQGLDNLIDGHTDSLTGKMDTYGRSLVMLKNRIVSELDTATGGAYAAARNAYAGPAALKSAVDKGRAFWGENAESITALTNGMTESEKAAFRVGAAEKLREMAGEQTGQNRLLDIWKNRNTREKLQALLGNDVKYAEVEKILKNEGTLKRLEQIGRGSPTAKRLALGEEEGIGVAADAMSLGVNASTHNWPGILGQMKKMQAITGSPEPVRDAVGKILLKQYSTPEINALIEAQETLRKLRSGGAAASGVIGGSIDPFRNKK